jgi:hypothetical protein
VLLKIPLLEKLRRTKIGNYLLDNGVNVPEDLNFTVGLIKFV